MTSSVASEAGAAAQRSGSVHFNSVLLISVTVALRAFSTSFLKAMNNNLYFSHRNAELTGYLRIRDFVEKAKLDYSAMLWVETLHDLFYQFPLPISLRQIISFCPARFGGRNVLL